MILKGMALISKDHFKSYSRLGMVQTENKAITSLKGFISILDVLYLLLIVRQS